MPNHYRLKIGHPSGSVEGNAGPFTPAPASTIASLTLKAAGAGTRPWTVGHTWRDGDLPAGFTGLHNVQIVPRTYWPSGAVKTSVISSVTAMAGASHVVALGIGASPSGTALTTASLKATGATASIGAGAFGSVTWSGTDWDSPFEQIISGPVMSSWKYRKPVGSDAHLTAWLEVRLYATGAVEVLPWIENGYLLVAGPTAKTETYTFTLGGVQRFSQTFTIYHHTRQMLMSGVLSYWLGTDNTITPQHDGAYAIASKMVPNYSTLAPSETALAARQTSYAPNYPGPVGVTMGDAGSHASLLDKDAIFYVGTGDSRAYKAMIAAGFGQGTWPIHYRDEVTNRPFKFSDRPDVSRNGGTALPAATGGQAAAYTSTHHPNYAYPAAIFSGWDWFVDECLLLNGNNYLEGDPQRRYNAEGIYFQGSGSYTPRGAGWSLRSAAQALALCPSTDPMYPELVTQWQQNMIRMRDWYVNGVLYSDAYVTNINWSNNMGMVAQYNDYNGGNARGTGFWTAPWQQTFNIVAVAFAWDLGLPVSAAANTAHQQFRDWLYKFSVGMFGDGTTEFSYRWSAYDIPAYVNKSTANYFASWAAVAAEYRARQTGIPLDTSDGLTIIDDGVNADASTFYDRWTGQAMQGLAYAVEHGATGADVAWARLRGSPSWALASAQACHDDPRLMIAPRKPAYMVGKAALQFFDIPGSALSASSQVLPSVGTQNGQQNMLKQWAGAASIRGVYVIHAQGGHSGYFGNEVLGIDLSVNAPAWAKRRERTPIEQATSGSNYYADGAPTSRHGYYSNWGAVIGGVPKIIRFNRYSGMAWEGGTPNTPDVRNDLIDAFNLSTNQYESQAYGPTLSDPNNNLGSETAMAKDHATGLIYAKSSGNDIWKWDPSSNTCTFVANLAGGSSGAAMVFDSVNQRLVWFAGRSAHTASYWAVGSGSVTAPTLTGPNASDITGLTGDNHGFGIAHDTKRNHAYLLGLRAGAVQLWRIRLSDFYVERIDQGAGTYPALPENGFWGRLQYIPETDAIVIQSTWDQAMQCMPLGG